jgi:hypothetical protein
MMVDAMDVLAMHLIWRFNNMSAQVAAADQAAKEKMRIQRDFLLDRLVEFTSSSKSNILEEVKKTVRS